MAYTAKIKQCRHVDDNQVNQLFTADESEAYYQGQALKIESGVVAPVDAVDDVVFGICESDHESSEYGFEVLVRQPRVGDTYTLDTDFDLEAANVGLFYGIKPYDAGYKVSGSGESKQWRLIAILGDRVGEFEFNRADQNSADIAGINSAIADIDEELEGKQDTLTEADELGTINSVSFKYGSDITIE